MRCLAAVLTLFLSAHLSVELAIADAPASPSGSRSAIDRGLDFLAKDAVAWKSEHNCVSCHHAGLVVWAMHEGKLRDHAADEAVLADMTKWLTESGDGKVGQERPASAPKAFNSKAMHFSLALEAVREPDEAVQASMKRLVATVEGDQTENGSWSSWPETRPPIFGDSNETLTVLGTLAVLPDANAGDSTAIAVRDKGLAWLAQTKSDDDPQSVAMRLVLWQRVGRSSEECQPLVERIRARQNTDGGWSQASDLASDAWATGQALYALAAAGIPHDDAAIARAHDFLINSQRDDGSWPMTSRPTKPGGEGSKSLIPITAAGSAWAVIGLARSE